MQFLLEHIHIYTGMPWWASIATLAVCTRLFALKFMITATDQQARQAKVRPMSAPIQQRMMLAMKNKDQIGSLKAKQELRALNRASGIQIWRSFLPILILIPTGFGQFRLGRGMADLPVPALESESLLWLPDMTMSDPFFILPLATGFMVYRTMKVGTPLHALHSQHPLIYLVPIYREAVKSPPATPQKASASS
jgi:YidC/Oxa1 family membrane protein insertase